MCDEGARLRRLFQNVSAIGVMHRGGESVSKTATPQAGQKHCYAISCPERAQGGRCLPRREHLTEGEMDKLLAALKGNWHGHRGWLIRLLIVTASAARVGSLRSAMG
jgi:hypothetical protein